MIVRSIDADGDWNFGKGRNDYLKSNTAIAQNIKTRLQSFLGDCFFAINEGLDWFNLLGSKNQIAVELAVRAVLLNTEGVTGVVSSTVFYDANNRNLLITYVVNTVYTSVSNAEALSGNTAFLLTESGDILTTEDGSGLEAG